MNHFDKENSWYLYYIFISIYLHYIDTLRCDSQLGFSLRLYVSIFNDITFYRFLGRYLNFVQNIYNIIFCCDNCFPFFRFKHDKIVVCGKIT